MNFMYILAQCKILKILFRASRDVISTVYVKRLAISEDGINISGLIFYLDLPKVR